MGGALCTTRKPDEISEGGVLDFGNMEEFDDAGTTFCIEPVKVDASSGLWNFLCTRNNNFSNRSQKGTLQVSNAYQAWVSATAEGFFGSANEGQEKVVILPDSVNDGDSLDFMVTTWLNRGEESTIVQLTGSDGGAFAADALVDDRWIELWIPYTGKSLSKPKAWFKEAAEDEWSEHGDASIEFEASTSYGVVQVNEGGYYTISITGCIGILCSDCWHFVVCHGHVLRHQKELHQALVSCELVGNYLLVHRSV